MTEEKLKRMKWELRNGGGYFVKGDDIPVALRLLTDQGIPVQVDYHVQPKGGIEAAMFKVLPGYQYRMEG